jgi:hypothetical protein
MRGGRDARSDQAPKPKPERAAPADVTPAPRPRVSREVLQAEAPSALVAAPPAAPAPIGSLPGEAEVDEALVDEAVGQINRLYTGRALEMAREIGGYVLDTFFGGDAENFRERVGGHATFQELSEREDLQFSKTWLWRAVSVHDQLARLPEDLAESLPYTHHTLLLPLLDDQKKVELAQAAVDQSWTKGQLADEVAKVRDSEKTSKGGRKALLPFVRTMNRLGATLEHEGAFAGLDRADQLPEAEVQRLLRLIEALRGQLDAVEAALTAEA